MSTNISEIMFKLEEYLSKEVVNAVTLTAITEGEKSVAANYRLGSVIGTLQRQLIERGVPEAVACKYITRLFKAGQNSIMAAEYEQNMRRMMDRNATIKARAGV